MNKPIEDITEYEHTTKGLGNAGPVKVRFTVEIMGRDSSVKNVQAWLHEGPVGIEMADALIAKANQQLKIAFVAAEDLGSEA